MGPCLKDIQQPERVPAGGQGGSREARWVRSLASSGLLAAISLVLALYVHFPLLPVAPYLLYDPSDIPVILAGLWLGPGWVLPISAVVALALGATAGGGAVGVVSRLVGSAALGVAAAVAFHRGGRRIGFAGVVAVAAYTAAEVLLTLLLVPLFMGGSLDDAVALLLPVVVPFNLLKGGINFALCSVIARQLTKTPAGFSLGRRAD
ncbi:MAG: ECF transporter S component [Limnochordaceae bacterium]|nr:ECF transporter S component [Limnochordaceae bacterium]